MDQIKERAWQVSLPGPIMSPEAISTKTGSLFLAKIA
jgi:hypothetical protein